MFKPIMKYGLLALAIDIASPYASQELSNLFGDYTGPIERVKVQALDNLEKHFSDMHFKFHNMDGVKWKGLVFSSHTENYWIDKAAYKISTEETKKILESTHELHNMCLEATDFAISDDEILTKVFDIPSDLIPLIRESWKQRQPDVLARYDFLIGGNGQIYFLECNGDTPSGIIESGPAQRVWADFQKLPQFNVLESNIAKAFKRIRQKHDLNSIVLFQNQNLEDSSTVEYLKQLLQENHVSANITEEPIMHFTDRMKDAVKSKESTVFWRQYPLEWLASEDAKDVLVDPQFVKSAKPAMIEPAWKILMSSKAMSVLLKEMYPDSPYLLNSSLAPFADAAQVSKQKFGREGEHIFFSNDFEQNSEFLESSYLNYFYPPVFQKFLETSKHMDRYITVSSWVVQGEVSSIVVREDLSHIIGTGSSVVPYFINEKIKNEPIEVELRGNTKQKIIAEELYPNREYKSNLNEITFKQHSGFNLFGFLNQPFNPSQVKSHLMSQYFDTYSKREEVYQKKFQTSSEEGNSEEFSKQVPTMLGFAPLAAAGIGAGMMMNNKGKKEQEEENNRTTTGYHGGGGGNGNSNSYYSPDKAQTATKGPAGSSGTKFSSHS